MSSALHSPNNLLPVVSVKPKLRQNYKKGDGIFVNFSKINFFIEI